MLAFILVLYMLVPDIEAVHIQLELPQVPSNHERVLWGFEFNQDDVHCLALNIYFEARGEPIEGQYAVADVVINRTESAYHPNTICEVIFFGLENPRTGRIYSCAFAWTCDRMQYQEPQDLKAFRRAIRIAEEVLFDPNYTMVIPDATHFHADWMTPWWSVRMENLTSIGNHKFYDSTN